ncbi:uncharacterized protein EV422DRAFT_531967, partial [Fimicolochytrium jonesii]|uniref:uncharacterized protein n=1 Tax=Fimicolochytrium jonesii TaxID=1396493 RepID=UPI0022FE7628
MEKRTIALVFSNSIEVEMEDGTKHFFASFFNRDQTFRVLRASWDAELEPCSCDGLGTCPTCFAKITRDRSTKKPSDDTTPSPIKSLGKTNLTRPLSSTSISSTDSQLTMVDGVQNAHLLPTPPLTPFADDVDMPEMEYVKALTADVKREVLGGTSHGHKTNDGEKGKDSMTRLPNKLEKASSHSTTAPAAAPTGQHTWHLPTIPTLPTFPIALPTSIPLPIPILTLPSPRQLALLSALTLFAVSLIALGLQSVALYRVLGVLEKVEGRLVSV